MTQSWGIGEFAKKGAQILLAALAPTNQVRIVSIRNDPLDLRSYSIRFDGCIYTQGVLFKGLSDTRSTLKDEIKGMRWGKMPLLNDRLGTCA
jgi:hypothetical protein